MKTLLLLCLCVCAVLADDPIEYDDYDLDPAKPAGGAAAIDPRGHRPSQRGRDSYSPGGAAPPPISGRGRYRGRPTAAPPTAAPQEEEIIDAGGCEHFSKKIGTLCPTGCELKTTILKQERNVKPTVTDLKRSVEQLNRDTNTVSRYVDGLSNELRERQKVTDGNGQLVGQYTSDLEAQHAFIKDAINNNFPSNIRIMQGILDTLRTKVQRLRTALQTQHEKCKDRCTVTCPIPVVSGKECEDIFRKGGEESQMYLLRPESSYGKPYKVFCDQTTLFGGWVTIQSRMDGSVDFGRRWDDYRRGFGNIAFDTGKKYCNKPGEYWLGNERISQLTKMGPTEVLFEMEDWSGAKTQARYTQFTIQSEATNYIMSVAGYSGTAGDTLLTGANELFGENRTMTIHNGMMFSTYDRDNDKWTPGDPSKQCSREDGGGWWYNRCHSANPNGRYYWGGSYTKYMAKHGTDDGMVWMNWKGSWYSLKSMCMKIRPFFQQ